MDGEHGRGGHLNVLTLDQDSVITGFGQHARVVAFIPAGLSLYCRVDRVPRGDEWKRDPDYPSLRDPAPAEILAVARKDQYVTGRWKLTSWTERDDGSSVDVHFTRA